jgi:pyruvate/2-oxoglutarate dehydrogenase complex dihydrolipoamide dehydrogenase (E3) component
MRSACRESDDRVVVEGDRYFPFEDVNTEFLDESRSHGLLGKIADMTFDLVIIGAGAAGIGAARAARAKGAEVVLVEGGRVGGDCTFTGCIPSKTIIEAANRGDDFATAMTKVHRAVEHVAASESAEVLRHDGIDVREGTARLAGPHVVEVDGRALSARAVVIATGANPLIPRFPGIETVEYRTYETLFDLTSLPKSLSVLGGGPTGVEMAQAFARLGSVVTIVEGAERLLPSEEPLASATLQNVFARCGIEVRTGTTVERVEEIGGETSIRLHLRDGSRVETDVLLVAVGRAPATSGLGLEDAGVRVDRGGFIQVDSRLRTTARGVFAAGDVAQPLQLTHVAYETGRIAALNALARVPVHRFRPAAVPRVTFTDPEVARVGVTESQAAARGGRVAFLPMTELDRAITAGRTEGFVKVVAGPRTILRGTAGGRILGATIVAPRAGEMIHELVLAMRSGTFPARLALTTHAYPTWSMAIQQAAAQFFGEFGGRSARPAAATSADPEVRQTVEDGST